MSITTEDRPVSAATLEHVLGTGDLSKLSTQQRVEYYNATCHTLGLNPLTRPMRFLALNGQIQLYFTRDGTDQLRKINGITLHVVDKQLDGDLFVVTVRARDKTGREDEDIGAVALPKAGESRANALMKGLTKAKRRVTLSICGLGQTDESELDTMPGAYVFDAEDPVPTAKIRTASAPAQQQHQPGQAPLMEPPPAPSQAPPGGRTDEQWHAWLDKLKTACDGAESRQGIVQISDRPSVGDAIATGPAWVVRDISDLLADAYAAFPEDGTGDLPPVEIAGAGKLAAG